MIDTPTAAYQSKYQQILPTKSSAGVDNFVHGAASNAGGKIKSISGHVTLKQDGVHRVLESS